jgi:hypothetical protein
MRYTAVPHISQLPRNGLILVGICVLRVTSFKSTKSSQILTLAQIIDPFNADVNLKYERCNFNSYLEISKRSPQMVVLLCCATIWCAPLLKRVLVGFCDSPLSEVSRTHQKCPRSYRVSAPFLSILAVSFISPFRGN